MSIIYPKFVLVNIFENYLQKTVDFSGEEVYTISTSVFEKPNKG